MGPSTVPDLAYLKRRCGKNRSGDQWYVRVVVPPDLREAIGKQSIERSLKTSDAKEAQRSKHAVLAEIFESFERARRHAITSADIEHEAQRYLREEFARIMKQPDDAFADLEAANGDDLGLAGDTALLELSKSLGDEDWPHTIINEARNVARSYGVELTASQKRELCRALLLANIEALSHAIACHKGENPEPLPVLLNARAVDPLTGTLRPRQRLIPIALYSGMRLDEMCGLRAADVREDEGVQFFDLQSYEGRRLKTAAARRCVPIHPELFRIGFRQYLERVRTQGHEFLFPALKPGGPDKKRSWYPSKRFTTYRRAVGVGGSDTVFHSFRKNAATALERSGVPETEAMQVIGHRKPNLTYRLYSGGLDLAGLVRVVEAIAYPGLDLSALRPHRSGRKPHRARPQVRNSPELAHEPR